MASVENKLQELLADLEITRHLLEIFDECGVDFVDLLSITTDQLRTALEPTQIPWKYSVLHGLISSWRTRNESKIVSFLTSLNPGYRLRLTGEANIVSLSVTSSESNQINKKFSQAPSSGAADESNPDYQHGSTSAEVTTSEYGIISSPARVNELAPIIFAEIGTTSPTVDSETEALDQPSADVTCRSEEVVKTESEHDERLQNEPNIERSITSEKPKYSLSLIDAAKVLQSSTKTRLLVTGTTRDCNLTNQRLYKDSSNVTTHGNDHIYQLPSTSAIDSSGYFSQGFVIVTTPSHVNPATGYANATKTTSPVTDNNTEDLDRSLVDSCCQSAEFGASLDEGKENQLNAFPSIEQTSPNVFAESSVTAAVITPHDSSVFTTKSLEKLLRHSDEGKEILDNAAKAELSDAMQQELVNIIAKHHLKTRDKLLTEDLRTYALAVTSLFKFERLETYFIPRSGDRKNHGGKIANKISNLKRRKRKRETKENEYQASRQATIQPQSARNEAAEEAAEWLTLNIEPWSVVLDRWKISFEARKCDLLSWKRIPQIFATYPQYKCQHGFQLIDVDFQKAFPNAENGLMKLPHLVPQITEFISKKAGDPSAVSLLERLSDAGSSNDKTICTLLLALNTVLPPIAVASRFKPTILVGQEDTLIFIDSKEQAQSKIQETYRSYRELDLPIVPKLFAVGENLDQLQGTFIVWYGDVCYELQSASRAVDVLIKLTAVLGLPYSKISKLVWHFLSGYIYGIKQRESYASINRLQTYLETKKSCIQ